MQTIETKEAFNILFVVEFKLTRKNLKQHHDFYSSNRKNCEKNSVTFLNFINFAKNSRNYGNNSRSNRIFGKFYAT